MIFFKIYVCLGYGRDGCTPNDVKNQIPASDGPIYEEGNEICTLLHSNSSCGSYEASYIVTDIEDKAEPANNYCYGYRRNIITKKGVKSFSISRYGTEKTFLEESRKGSEPQKSDFSDCTFGQNHTVPID